MRGEKKKKKKKRDISLLGVVKRCGEEDKGPGNRGEKNRRCGRASEAGLG
jgi:hypothetical protein